MKRILLFLLLLVPLSAEATRFTGLRVVDRDILMVCFQDGDVRYRDDGTGESAFLGHTFVEGDDTLVVFSPRLDLSVVRDPGKWVVSSPDDPDFGPVPVLAVWRKSKPMHTDHTLSSESDHWLFLRLPRSMRKGCTYRLRIPEDSGSDRKEAEVRFDPMESPSEAVHVNLLGYTPAEPVKTADLYLWLGDGGPRDYSSFVGKRVWLLDLDSGVARETGSVSLWQDRTHRVFEAGSKDLTGSSVWKIDFKENRPGRYRLCVEDVGCSMDFEIREDLYYEPYKTSLRGYYYVRLGEPADAWIIPVPRQPRFIPGEDPEGLIVYKTDLHPWHPLWRKLKGDVWDEPHFKAPERSAFWKHRLPGHPINTLVRGGHSDAFDWDRHLAHVSNIYDLLLPYLLTGGRLCEDDLGIRESGNGIPDLIDEARNEVDFFLSIRDGEAYSQGVTNPSKDWKYMFQAGCTTMAAWANAANCAILAEAFRVLGNESLESFYRDEAVKAFRFAERQENSQLDDLQGIGNQQMRGRDFRQMAAAFLYNLTGDRQWEEILAAESVMISPESPIEIKGRTGYCQLWGTAAYLTCPRERHNPDLYEKMVAAVFFHAERDFRLRRDLRPSRRSADDPRWVTSENLQVPMLAHYLETDPERRRIWEQMLYDEAGWGLGRNPSNTVEMTGLGQRHITDCYTTGRNDGSPGSHPGHTPFNGTETWSEGNGGDARILLDRCYPAWKDGGWPRQESFFNQRYFWVNGEFTPRETMRGKMALLAYLYGIRP